MNANFKYACNYALLRYLPYPETGEFVNLGVVVHCPERRFLDSQVEMRRDRRVTEFFPELDRPAFEAARQAMVNELDRVAAMVAEDANPEFGQRLFRELVRPREAVFRFGEIRTILTDAPATLAGTLFEQYVNRQFAQRKEHQETP